MLSGSTWKGAKLRIGEAKPDFRERYARSTFSSYSNRPTVLIHPSILYFVTTHHHRIPTLFYSLPSIQRSIVRENARTEPSDRPKKRPRLARGVQGVHAPSMDPITPSTVEEYAHKGWYVTPLGRLIRPMRMRPARPLDPPLIATTTKDKKDKKDKKGKAGKDGEGEGDEKKKVKKRKKVPDVRARRKTIDPVKYGSSHVIGAFLGGGEGDTVAQNTPPLDDEVSDSDESSSSSSSEEEVEDDHDAKNDHPDTALKKCSTFSAPSSPSYHPISAKIDDTRSFASTITSATSTSAGHDARRRTDSREAEVIESATLYVRRGRRSRGLGRCGEHVRCGYGRRRGWAAWSGSRWRW